jgi:lysophospholipase L1-like esterase
VVLLGDSVFDNAAYVGSDPDVRQQLEAVLPKGARASLLARDGAVMADVVSQLRRLPADATHVVVSVGGNDALGASAILEEGASSVAEAITAMAAVRDRFCEGYVALLDAIVTCALPIAVCTIYEARFPERSLRRIAATALTMLNDCITREAFARGLSVIDLRLICDSDPDFANPIEPSARGGEKIARAIARFATGGAVSASVYGH